MRGLAASHSELTNIALLAPALELEIIPQVVDSIAGCQPLATWRDIYAAYVWIDTKVKARMTVIGLGIGTFVIGVFVLLWLIFALLSALFRRWM